MFFIKTLKYHHTLITFVSKNSSKKTQDIKKQVQYLTFYGDVTIAVSALLALPELFPSLKQVVCLVSYDTVADAEEFDNPDDYAGSAVSQSASNIQKKHERFVNHRIAEHWNNITGFKEEASYPLAAAILENGGLCNLIDLDVGKDPADIDDDDDSDDDSDDGIDDGIDDDSDDGIHDDSDDVKYGYNFTSLIKQLSKAPKLKTLRLACVSKFESLKVNPHGFNWDVKRPQLEAFVSSCPRLKCYDVNQYPITPEILAAMDENGIKLEAMTTVANNLPKQIDDLLFSNQKDSIKTMTLSFPLNSSFMDAKRQDLFNSLQGFPNLKCLTIKCGVIPINEILQCCKYLETIKLQYCQLVLASGASADFTTKLKHLILEEVKMTRNGDVSGFISKTCPALTRLEITYKYISCILEFKFPDHKFTSIKVSITEGNRRQRYVVKNVQGTRICRMTSNGLVISTDPLESFESNFLYLTYASCDALKIEDTYVSDP
ncbi:hypothetical protein [Parasitella parasitica]|uniref:F-box domain-containing protein n=1 Tax=Parasitella parasitica TaxID=35722 RepID=A0A0B7NT71_9FUNG|nr:hypothetical protein [Parasitella parasitica]